jgi:hypothetical protein
MLTGDHGAKPWQALKEIEMVVAILTLVVVSAVFVVEVELIMRA